MDNIFNIIIIYFMLITCKFQLQVWNRIIHFLFDKIEDGESTYFSFRDAKVHKRNLNYD